MRSPPHGVEHCGPPGGLDVVDAALDGHDRHLGIGQDVLGMLGNAADEDDGAPLRIEAVGGRPSRRDNR